MSVSLLEVQRAWRHALDSGEAGPVAPWIAGKDIDAAARLAIYRNNTRTNLRAALRSDFPVVERLVGAEFFAHAANAYIADNPSHSGNLGDYGGEFPEFLAAFPPAQPLVYLADVARIERAWVEVFLAAEASSVDFSGLSAIPPGKLGTIRFGFHPAVRLLASPYPALTIWRVNQPDHEEAGRVDLDTGGEFILLRRCDDAVELILLGQAEYVWLVALYSGSRLDAAVEVAFSIAPDFDLPDALQRHVAAGTFITYSEGA